MWASLLAAMISTLAGIVLPMLKDLLDKLIERLQNNKVARGVMAKAKPANAAEFRAALEPILEAELDEMKKLGHNARKLGRLKKMLSKPRVLDALWNRLVVEGAVTGSVEGDVSYTTLVRDAQDV